MWEGEEGAGVLRDKWGKIVCEHGRRKNQCKECGGSSICEHGRRKSRCNEPSCVEARARNKAAKAAAKRSKALSQAKAGAKRSRVVVNKAAKATAGEAQASMASVDAATAQGTKRAYKKRGRRQKELPNASLPPPPPPKRARGPPASPQLLLPATSPKQAAQGDIMPAAPVSHRRPSDSGIRIYRDEKGNICEVIL